MYSGQLSNGELSTWTYYQAVSFAHGSLRHFTLKLIIDKIHKKMLCTNCLNISHI